MQHLRIIVLSGGPSSEHAVSLKSGAMVYKHLNRKKYIVTKMIIQRDGKWVIGNTKPKPLDRALEFLRGCFDCAFIAMHGEFGEDGTLQRLLEGTGLRYTGPDVKSSALAMDKHKTNRVIVHSGILVPAWRILHNKKPLSLSFPFVIKPVNGGSSVDTAIIRSAKQFHAFMKKVRIRREVFMAQKFIQGRELTCGVLEKNGRPFALPPTEIRPKSSTWFDYKAKYKTGGSEEITPAELTAVQTKMIQSLALRAHKVLGGRGMSRSDFILADGKFWYLETNTIPGLTTTSLLPQEAKAMGIGFSAMLDFIIDAANRAKP